MLHSCIMPIFYECIDPVMSAYTLYYRISMMLECSPGELMVSIMHHDDRTLEHFVALNPLMTRVAKR